MVPTAADTTSNTYLVISSKLVEQNTLNKRRLRIKLISIISKTMQLLPVPESVNRASMIQLYQPEGDIILV